MTREPEPDHPDGDQALVDRARRQGDMGAFEVLYRRYVERIHGFAYRRSGSAVVAEDVTSATFERALRNLGSFRWRGGGFAPWLFRIAANELADHYRRAARDRDPRTLAFHLPHRADDVEETVVATLDSSEVRDAMSRLNPRHQRALSLRYLSGLSNAEAADAMGTSPRAFAVTVHRALGALARQLGHSREQT